jgi:hypothetical protein
MNKNGLMHKWIDGLMPRTPANEQLWSAAASEARRRFPFDTKAASRFALPPHSINSLVNPHQSNNPIIHQSFRFGLC